MEKPDLGNAMVSRRNPLIGAVLVREEAKVFVRPCEF
jgi:hypothetical protein